MPEKGMLITVLAGMLFLFALMPSEGSATELRIAIKPFPPFVFKDELKGFCIDLANIICRKHNLTPRYVWYRTVPEVLHAVESGECHLNFSGLTITAEREKRVDFSQPFFDSGLMVAVRSDPESRRMDVLRNIAGVVGLSLLVFMVGLSVVAHVMWFVEKNDADPKSFSTQYKRGILDAYWWAVVTMTTVGYGDKCPRKFLGRIIASIWMIIGIIWFAGFTATLSSSLIVDRMETREIKGVADLYNRKVAVISATTSESYLRYHHVSVVPVETFDDLIQNLKTRQVDAVVYDAPALMYHAKNDPDVKVVGDMFDEQRYGVVFPQREYSPIKEIFNISLLEMQKSGEYQKIYDKWF